MANLVDQGDSASPYALNAVRTSLAETICSWTVRLVLPMVLGVGGLLFYWVWIDSQPTMVAWRIAGMVPLAVSFAAIAIWAFEEWLPPRDDR
jgi:hypothetical protein